MSRTLKSTKITSEPGVLQCTIILEKDNDPIVIELGRWPDRSHVILHPAIQHSKGELDGECQYRDEGTCTWHDLIYTGYITTWRHAQTILGLDPIPLLGKLLDRIGVELSNDEGLDLLRAMHKFTTGSVLPEKE